jgi:hypothetical protein
MRTAELRMARTAPATAVDFTLEPAEDVSRVSFVADGDMVSEARESTI